MISRHFAMPRFPIFAISALLQRGAVLSQISFWGLLREVSYLHQNIADDFCSIAHIIRISQICKCLQNDQVVRKNGFMTILACI